MSDIDAFDEGPAVNDANLEALLKQAEELIGLENQIADLEGLLKRLSGRANELKTQAIPDKMAEIGLSEFATPDGGKLNVEEFVSGTLPRDPDKRAEAIKQIESWDAAEVIKNEINLSFSRSQHNEAMALAEDLRQKGFDCEVTSSVHPQTYLALIRERLAEGEPIDTDVMGVFVGRRAKITLPKAKKVKG
jgi:hypothetical protein